jgi:hypothetical protein
MDQKELVKWGLIALGAYLIYKYIEDNGGLSAVLGTGAAASTTTPAQVASTATSTSATSPPAGATTPATPPASTPVGTTSKDAAGNLYTWNGSAWAFTPVTCPTGQHLLNGVCTPYTTSTSSASSPPCPSGQVLVNGVCTTEPTGATLISQQMLNAATAAGEPNNLDMDQWDYYYQMVTGNAFPVDPGSIAPGVYAGAGIVDRTTPTDIGTWLAIMQNQAPQLGLSGMSAFSIPRFTPPWMVM